MAFISELEDNLDALQAEMQKLIEVRDDVMTRVIIAEQQQMKRLNQVQGWLKRVEAVEAEVRELQRIQTQVINNLCLGGYCSKKCISSYKFGKEVSTKLKVLADLKDEGDFKDIAERTAKAPLIEEMPIEPRIIGQESIFDDAWRCMIEEQVGIIGLYGAGGVGKTTLLKQLNNKLCQERHDFDIVIWVVVSKDLNLEKVQEDIGKKIDMFSESWKNKSPVEKSCAIFKILSNKKFVLLLDDMWEPVDLTKVGVPIPNSTNASKVVFTTRYKEVCGKMEAHKKLRVECLTADDAWMLFKVKVGEDTIDSHPEIPKHAQLVAKECGGLPLAIITIGRAMSCKNKLEEWKHAVNVLKKSSSKFPGMDAMYPHLKFSYDRLPDNKIRSCFLYCSLFPEDYKISKEDLIDCWIGEEFFDEEHNGIGARNEGYAIIGDLIRSCLLEEDADDFVELHDVVRDMALWIASEIEKEKEEFFVRAGVGLTEAPGIEKWKGVKRMSLMNNKIRNLSEPATCPHLLTLFLQNNRLSNITANFFQFMPSLKVLNLSNNFSLREFRPGISKLISLQYLNLSSTGIRVLPEELKALKDLSYLNMERTPFVRRIPRQLISNFPLLRVLRMLDCGALERAEHGSVLFNGGEILIEELLCLNHLSVLSVCLESDQALRKFLSSYRLKSSTQTLRLRKLKKESESLRTLSLTDMEKLRNLFIADSSFEKLQIDCVGEIRKTPETSRFHNLHRVGIVNCESLKDITWLIFAPNLRILEISECFEMKEIISKAKVDEFGATAGNHHQIPFAKLESLKLARLPNLESVYWTPLSLSHLKEIRIFKCPRLWKLPLDSNSAKERKIVIKGEIDWWHGLQFDLATRNAFSPCFISDYEERKDKLKVCGSSEDIFVGMAIV